MREQNIPLFALESQEPIRDLISLGSLLVMKCVIPISSRYWISGGIPLKSADRGEDFPIVIGGGAHAYNPEPLAPFFDLFLYWKARRFDALFDAYKANKKVGGSRRDFLLAAAKIPGIYVPSLYEVTYIKKTARLRLLYQLRKVFQKVQKQLIIDMEKRISCSGGTGCSTYQGYTGSCDSGNPARMHPWMSFSARQE